MRQRPHDEAERAGGRLREADPARRDYRRIAPRPELVPYVESFWVQQAPPGDSPAPATTVLPTGRVELLVHYGDPFDHRSDGEVSRMPTSYVMGQRTRPVAARARGATGLIMACFQPWAAGALLRSHGEEALDRAVPLEQILDPARVGTLEDRIHDAHGIAQRVRVVERFLLDRLHGPEPDRMVVQAVRLINREWGRTTTGGLAATLGLSRRHLQRRFVRAVGMPPKTFARIVRAQKTVGLLRQGVSSLDAVFRCGYVDQAHLIHEVGRVTGRSAGAFFRGGPDTPLQRAFNDGRLSHFYNTAYL